MTTGGATAIALASLLPAGCSADYPQAEGDKIELKSLSEKQYAVARGVSADADVNAAARPQRALTLHLRARRAQVEHRDEAAGPKRRAFDMQGRGNEARLGPALLCRAIDRLVPVSNLSTRVRPVAPSTRTAN